LPDLNISPSGGEDFQTSLTTLKLTASKLPAISIIHQTSTEGTVTAGLVDELFIGQSSFLENRLTSQVKSWLPKVQDFTFSPYSPEIPLTALDHNATLKTI
jgi:hypothetical protein